MKRTERVTNESTTKSSTARTIIALTKKVVWLSFFSLLSLLTALSLFLSPFVYMRGLKRSIINWLSDCIRNCMKCGRSKTSYTCAMGKSIFLLSLSLPLHIIHAWYNCVCVEVSFAFYKSAKTRLEWNLGACATFETREWCKVYSGL